MGLLWRVLFGTARLPDEMRTALEAEGLELLEEELRGSVTYRHYRAPGERTRFDKEGMAMTFAISTRRLVVWTRNGKHIELARDHPLFPAIDVTVEAPDRVCLAYDAERFRDDRSGRVEIRLRTANAQRIVELLRGAT